MMYQDVLNMERSYVWFWEYIHLPHDFYHAYDCWVDDNIMPSIQYLQDGMRCCLDHKGCPAELCHVQNPKKIQIKTATIEDYLNKRG
jgi:hypothetical protein